mmetsp:Transcript_12914/g.26382  ORF Transcript_12914/g.26382 Transcript_12914/m.26382 type:complete len:242 (-) Transcript_12914:1272-1997(-)
MDKDRIPDTWFGLEWFFCSFWMSRRDFGVEFEVVLLNTPQLLAVAGVHDLASWRKSDTRFLFFVPFDAADLFLFSNKKSARFNGFGSQSSSIPPVNLMFASSEVLGLIDGDVFLDRLPVCKHHPSASSFSFFFGLPQALPPNRLLVTGFWLATAWSRCCFWIISNALRVRSCRVGLQSEATGVLLTKASADLRLFAGAVCERRTFGVGVNIGVAAEEAARDEAGVDVFGWRGGLERALGGS